jgi:hypothetical protein
VSRRHAGMETEGTEDGVIDHDGCGSDSGG